MDAIHFDDYFYPYDGTGNVDAATFKKYGAGIASIADWRRNNVDTLIYSIHNAISAYNRRTGRKVQFGISPFGIWGNAKDIPGGSLTSGSQSYSKQFADTRKWVKREWIDYIVPQVYWPFGRDVAPYAAITDWWCTQVRGTRGAALYRAWGLPDGRSQPDVAESGRDGGSNEIQFEPQPSFRRGVFLIPQYRAPHQRHNAPGRTGGHRALLEDPVPAPEPR